MAFETRLALTPIPGWWMQMLCAALVFLIGLLLLVLAPELSPRSRTSSRDQLWKIFLELMVCSSSVCGFRKYEFTSFSGVFNAVSAARRMFSVGGPRE